MKLSLMCKPEPCQLFVNSVTTPQPDHEACPNDLFTCGCTCHVHVLEGMKLESITLTTDEGFPGSSVRVMTEDKMREHLDVPRPKNIQYDPEGKREYNVGDDNSG